jgi:hypothetical protein
MGVVRLLLNKAVAMSLAHQTSAPMWSISSAEGLDGLGTCLETGGAVHSETMAMSDVQAEPRTLTLGGAHVPSRLAFGRS